MKFGLMFANAGPFSDPDVLAHLATTAEQVGIESIWSVEHVVVPVGYKSAYPYDKSGKLPGPNDMALPDPLLPLAYAAAVTKELRLATGILILPQRHPLYVAKEAATLDVLSKGRAILGIGIGWLEEEFDALGIPFKDRAARTSESVRAIRSLWQPEASAFDGKFFRWSPVESHPKPIQTGGVPIVVGGHGDMSAKRAARYGDGYFPGKGNNERLAELLGIMRAECERLGRNADEIEITAGAERVELDSIRQRQDMGVSRLIIPPPGFDRDTISRGLGEFGDRVLAKL